MRRAGYKPFSRVAPPGGEAAFSVRPPRQGLETSYMKKDKAKPKATGKEAAPNAGRAQVVKLKPRKPRVSLAAKLPPVKQYWTTSKQFVIEAWQELKKVTWPNRSEALGTTGVVLVLVILLSIYLGLVDFALARLVKVFIH